MSMIKRGKSGEVTNFTEKNGQAIVCISCGRVIPSLKEVKEGDICPFCDQNVKDIKI